YFFLLAAPTTPISTLPLHDALPIFASPDEARGDADLVIHASGAPSGLATALALAGFEAKVVELSWYGDRLVDAPLGGAFHSRRLDRKSTRLNSSHVKISYAVFCLKK